MLLFSHWMLVCTSLYRLGPSSLCHQFCCCYFAVRPREYQMKKTTVDQKNTILVDRRNTILVLHRNTIRVDHRNTIWVDHRNTIRVNLINNDTSQKVTARPAKIGHSRSHIVPKQQRRLTGKKITAGVTKPGCIGTIWNVLTEAPAWHIASYLLVFKHTH